MELDSAVTCLGVLFIVAAGLGILAEAFSQHAWPRRTLIPGGIVMILGVLLMAAVN